MIENSLRGKVIGGIHFSIEGLLRGLSETDCSKLLLQSKQLGKKAKKYKFIVDAAGYQKQLVENPGVQEFSSNSQRDYERLAQLKMQKSSLTKRIKSIRTAQKDNARFVEYVDNMGLRVKDENDHEIKVTKENLIGFNTTQQYLSSEVLMLKASLSEIESLIEEIEAAIGEDDLLVNANEESILFDRQISKLKLNFVESESALKAINEQKKEIDRQLRTIAISSNKAFDVMNAFVRKYCKELGVIDLVDDESGILTNNLKSKSGTKYELLVFAFRLAYASTVFHVKGINLPIIVDSIRGREMSRVNFNKCIDLLFKEMSNHQIIIASISNSDLETGSQILIHSKLMENPQLVSDISEWENQE